MTLHRGKIATHPDIIAIRPMVREDLALILEKRVGADGRPIQGAVTRFRDPHHRIARLFASGLRLGEVVERCGFSTSRVATLLADPAFQNLIAEYRSKVDAAFVRSADEFYETASANMRKAERMIAERLEEADDPDAPAIPLKTLVDISADRMDRFGYGKRQTNLNVNADFASILEKAISRSGKATIIEATGVTPSLAPPQSPQEPDPVSISPKAPEEPPSQTAYQTATVHTPAQNRQSDLGVFIRRRA